MEKKKEREPLSQSFVMGIIALVFLIIGYQTALFLHHSAIMRIEANRDAPDTVFVYQNITRAGDSEVGGRLENHEDLPGSAGRNRAARENGPGKTVKHAKDSLVRRNARHSPRVQSVRNNLPVRRIESFKFDPNSVSVEDLCRLGFTPKQAQSIDNYRNKGGRFYRKSDFAKSFVVSDSIYARLESYIDIPMIDLNLADSAAFDALPGIGGWFASKMVSHRDALRGYSYKEQLMDIWKFDREKFDGLSDLITISPVHQRPYPLWTLPADSLRLHPYLDTHSAKGIVLYRENNPPEKWTVKGLAQAGILTPENAEKLARCLLQ